MRMREALVGDEALLVRQTHQLRPEMRRHREIPCEWLREDYAQEAGHTLECVQEVWPYLMS